MPIENPLAGAFPSTVPTEKRRLPHADCYHGLKDVCRLRRVLSPHSSLLGQSYLRFYVKHKEMINALDSTPTVSREFPKKSLHDRDQRKK